MLFQPVFSFFIQFFSLADHMVKTGNPECDFVFDDVKILDTGSYDKQIKLIESIL